MSKTDKKREPKQLTPQESGYTLRPWSCNHYPTFSEIEAYIPITGDWEIVSDIHDTKGVDAEILAGLIARAVNSFEKNRDIISRMTVALELCLDCDDRLNAGAAHEAQTLLNRVKRMG